MIERKCIKCGRRVRVKLDRAGLGSSSTMHSQGRGRPRAASIKELPRHLPRDALKKILLEHNRWEARGRKKLNKVKGYVGGRRRLIRTATEAVIRAQAFAYKGRRLKKREFRRLWITRLSAAARLHGLLYSRFIHGLKKAGITLDRKQLSELAIHDEAAFGKIVDQVKVALSS